MKSLSHLGGYTVPQKIRSFNWLLRDGYSPEGTVRFPPAPEAYQPHTIVLLEGSYPRKYGPGRKPAYEYVYRIVRPVDIEPLIKKYNSAKAPPSLLESMDNTFWPWKKQMEREQKEAQATQTNGLPPDTDAAITEAHKVADQVPSAESDETKNEPIVKPGSKTAQNLRDIYLPMLESQPFFRPLIIVTLPTRPLAVALSHFFKALAFGWSYHAFVLKHDTIEPKLASKMKQYLPSLDVEHQSEKEKYHIQTRNLRLARVVEVTYKLAEFVIAARGGQPALARLLQTTDRTISRDQLRAGEPAADIVINVGVGSWYNGHEKIVKDFEDATKKVLSRFPGVLRKTQGEYSCPIVIRKVDVFGRQYDLETGELIPWPPPLIRTRPETHVKFAGMIGQRKMIENQMKNRPPGMNKEAFLERSRKLQVERESVTEEGMEHFEKYKYEIASWKSHTDGVHVTYLSD